jgi:hypothetical protein
MFNNQIPKKNKVYGSNRSFNPPALVESPGTPGGHCCGIPQGLPSFTKKELVV